MQLCILPPSVPLFSSLSPLLPTILPSFSAALADGLRAVYLRPDLPKGHLRYIQALNGCKETARAQVAYKRYVDLFPNQKDQELLKAAVDKSMCWVDRRCPHSLHQHMSWNVLFLLQHQVHLRGRRLRCVCVCPLTRAMQRSSPPPPLSLSLTGYCRRAHYA